jgi:hypothetical protein
MGIKIKYHVTEKLTFRGTVEVDEATYEAMQEAAENDDDDTLGQLILDNIDQRDPQDWDIDAVDEFEKAS